MNSIVRTVLSLLVTTLISAGIGVGYYLLGLQGWVRAWRLPSWRRLMAGVFGGLAFMAGLSFTFLNGVGGFLRGFGLDVVTSILTIIVAFFWALLALIAWLVILAVSRDSIEH